MVKKSAEGGQVLWHFHSTFGTVGIYAKTVTLLDLRNNIVVNTSDHAGNTGWTVAYRRYDATLGSYQPTSDNNDFYVSSNQSTGNYIFCDGSSSTPNTIRDSTMAQYQARVAPRDAASFSELPPFINVAGTPYDLHIKNDVATLCESGGNTISTPAITNDIDNEFRFPNAGYPNSVNPAYAATLPDVGADEFGGIHAYQPLHVNAVVTSAHCPTSNDGLVDLTDIGGVPPYTYIWSNGATTQDLTGLAAGAYSVTVTDNAAATVTDAWTVGLVFPSCNSTASGTVSTTGCYNAYQTLTVSGLTVTAPNGNVELIAGSNLLMMPGTVVESGAWLWGHISMTFCTPVPPMVATATGQDEQPAGLSTATFSIYPNPTSGNMTLV